MSEYNKFRALRKLYKDKVILNPKFTPTGELLSIDITGGFKSIDLADLLHFKEIRSVKFINNSLAEVDLDPLAELENLIRFTFKENNRTERLNLSPLEKLPYLSQLIISQNTLTELNTTPIKRMEGLTYLSVSEVGGYENTRNRSRFSNFYYNWYNYRYYQDAEGDGVGRYNLDVDECYSRLKTLDLTFLEHHPNLTKVDASYNRGVKNYKLPKSAPKSLESIDLSENDLKKIKITNFISEQTVDFVARYAGITDIDARGFNKTDKLFQVNLSHNKLTSFDLEGLRCSTHLTKLDLSRNRLTEIDLNPISGLYELNSLILESNDLHQIDLTPLKDLKNLDNLRLGDNLLEHIDLTPLEGLKRLRVLRLTRNNLTEIDLKPLRNLTVLTRLQLARNRLVSIDLSPLSQIRTLEELNLDRNDFKEANLKAIENFDRLSFVDLRRASSDSAVDITSLLKSNVPWVQFEATELKVDVDEIKDIEVNANLANSDEVLKAIDFKKNSKKLLEAKSNQFAKRAIQENEDIEELMILRFIENRKDVANQLSRRINELKKKGKRIE